ncbi:variant erythrocyte surface antigen-1 family protein [Babesia caballi]|uniref:Variant erythrocyte surface antigen-1 family protein n=1 Tax=Babesia caballi TaxID=5871 RepID=A0AAV4M4M7_BABCB|nr:variant erythrocyte surface antigen-1 family protein [Babesia caballi]
MTSQQKSLTEAPTNLKEAIDWVLRVSGGDGKYMIYTKNFIEDLHTILSDPLNINDDVVKAILVEIEKDKNTYPEGPFKRLSEGLRTFIGYALLNEQNSWKWKIKGSGIVQNGDLPSVYTSAYDSTTTYSNIDRENAKKKALQNLFTAIELIFEGLTELFFNCKTEWAGQRLSGNSGGTDLNQFMDKSGFSETQLNTDMKGERIMSQALKGFEELSTAYSAVSTNPSLDAFRSQLEQNAWSNPSEYPLTSLYILATYVYVQSTGPATPSFAGYSGLSALAGGAYGLNLGGDYPANLKEAIDWILRVTGKDGQDQGGGTGDGTTALSGKVKELLESVQGSGSGLGAEFEKVIKVLSTDGSSGTGIIGKLADGLQQFIGYNGTNISSGPLITGGGILPANVAKHQVCNAVLNFVIRFLDGLCGIEQLKDDPHKPQVWEVIRKLRKCVGTGQVPQGFEQLVGKIGEKVDGISKKVLKNTQGKLKEVFTQLKVIKPEEMGTSISSESQAVEAFLGKVDNALKEDNSVYFKTYCEKLAALLKNSELKSKAQQNDNPLNYSSLESNIKGVTGATTNLNNDIHSINTNTEKKHLIPNAAVFTAVRDAATAFIADIKEPGKYTSFYNGVDNKNAGNVQCAKIFLGCLPLYYQALTYIYWGCHDKGGGWNAMTLGGGALKSYFDSQGLLPLYVDRSKTGAHIAESALKGFTEFGTAATSLSSPNSPYVKFTQKLQEKVTTNGNNLPSTCPLSALFYGASCYFRCQQITTAKSGGGTPKTIREMLYFLAALQFSPQYDAFDRYVTTHFRTLLGKQSEDSTADSDLKLQVADSGTSTKGNTHSAADLKSYLASTFHLAPAFIGLVQEPSTPGEPWLHSLFSNSQFNLSIPSSGPGIFSALSNYAYALQFQLSFLYIQCRNTYTVGCGWQECTYGRDVNASGTSSLTSHICPGFKCQDATSCDHKSSQCKHNNYSETNSCGKGSNLSPLQAFLTDNLKDFSREHPSDPSSHLASCSGQMCHVPMGFNPNDLRAASNGQVQGVHIAYALGSFCGGFNTPLRQLSEKLGCLTKRTPRTLGDMFGFTWHLKGQLAKTLGSLQSAQWFRELKDKLPFSYQLTDDSGQKLNKFVGTDHTSHGNSTADLTSLYSPKCNQQNQNCGPYLYPLTHSDGATYAPRNASTYLSWVLYLTDELETGFQELIDTFNGHACKGCKHNCFHSTGSAATACSCPSVVDCADVLPLLYRDGFRFLSTFRLKGMKKESSGKGYTQTAETKRQCSAFATQLQSVISGNPLKELLQSIDEFLYLFRHYFLSNLSTFWTIYIGLILYTFFFLLDTLHFRSHLHFPSSHNVPPSGLLTSGTPLPITKLAYLTQ